MTKLALKPPSIRPETQQEHHKAKWWRLHVANLSIEQLAKLTGYSQRSIYLMELGCNAQGKPVREWVFQRYRMACAGVYAQMITQKEFDWQ